jgi:hypothetical protein
MKRPAMPMSSLLRIYARGWDENGRQSVAASSQPKREMLDHRSASRHLLQDSVDQLLFHENGRRERNHSSHR